jgi:hypothetical protein
MKLRNQAVQRGTSALISTQTHVEKGSKIAKGQDALDGVMSQFSSLMSVMQDDFALMSDMEREYEGEKSEVEPTLPEGSVVDVTESDDAPIFEEYIPSVDAETFDEGTVDLERDYSKLLSDTVPLSLQEMTEHPALFTPAPSENGTTVIQGVYSPEMTTPNSVPAPVPTTPILTEGVERQMAPVPTKQVLVQTPQQVPEVLVEEVLNSLQPMVVEEVEVEDDVPRFEQSERQELPQFMREAVRLLDDEGLLPQEPIDSAGDTTLKATFEQVVQSQTDAQIQTVVPQMSDIQVDLQAMMNAVMSQGVQGAQIVQPTVTPTADGVSIQQQKSVEIVRDVKLPKMPLTRQHFEELLEESQQKGTEQMGFRSKLIQRLEMVIMDPMGRMDVEVAQEVSGVNVKAVVPVEIVSSLLGLENDLQVALDQQGLELNNFELYERSEEAEKQGRTGGSNDEELAVENDLNEKTLTGGMLVNRRV